MKNKLSRFMTCLLILFGLAMQIGMLNAQTPAWGFNRNHRLSVSFDGNSAPDFDYKWPYGDPDDWGALAATLGIIAKLDLHENLVHLSYNNFIDAPAGPDNENQLKIGADQGLEKLGGFKECVFFDVTTQLDESVSSLASEIGKSTDANRLYFLHAGLSEWLYLVVEEVIANGNIEALNHFYLVSHSGFNESETRRDWHHTWADVQNLAGNRIKYQKIVDQNAGWKTGDDFSPWYWMRDHSDSKVVYMWDRLEVHSGNVADISDCGMAYYLLWGDEYGNASKFQSFIGGGIDYKTPGSCIAVPVESISVTESSTEVFLQRTYNLSYEVLPENATNKSVNWTSSNTGVVSVSSSGKLTGVSTGTALVTATTNDGGFTDQVNVTVSELPSCTDISYVAINDFDDLDVAGFVPSYKDNSRNAIAVDAVEYKDQFGAAEKPFTGVTSYYDITVTTLTEEDGESTFRLRVGGNLIGEFQNPEAVNDLDPYSHTFTNVLVSQGDIIQVESNTHSNGKIPEGDGFAYARGRWRQLDFACANACLVQEANGLLIFEAERFQLFGDWKIGQDSKASGGEYIYFDGNNHYAEPNHAHTISYTFKINNPGHYGVKWIMRQPAEHATTDLGNDAWIYFSNNVGYAEDLALEHYEKFYGRSDAEGNFAFNGVAEVHNVGHKWLTAHFDNPGEYTLNISGRSAELQIDRFVMYKDMSVEEAEAQAGQIAETSNCDDPGDDPVTGVSVSPTSVSLTIGGSSNLSATVLPSSAGNKAVTWSSSNTNVASVSSGGVVTGIGVGLAIITATTAEGGFTAISNVTVIEPSQIAYPNGTPHAIPGKIESEDFDQGGEGVAYNDADAANNGCAYRPNEGVDIEAASEGGFNVGWIATGEWLEYTVNVPASGNYDMDIRYAAASTAGTIHIESDGTDKTGAISLPSTGGWQTYQTVAKSINLSAGVQVLRIAIDANGMNLNYIEFSSGIILPTSVSVIPETLILDPGQKSNLTATVLPADAADKSLSWSSSNNAVATVSSTGEVTAVAEGSATIFATTNTSALTDNCLVTVNSIPDEQQAYPDGIAHVIPGTIEAVSFDIGGEGIAYHDNEANNQGTGPRQNEGVDTEFRTTSGNVGWIAQGEWLEYSVNVLTSTIYTIEAQVASTGNNGKFHIEFNGSDKTGVQSVASTGNWGTFNTHTISDVSLTAGIQIMRVYMDGGSFNLAAIEFVADIPVIHPDGISVSPTSVVLDVDQTASLTATVSPENADDKSVAWSSNDSDIATVSVSGVVTAISAGNAIITATTNDGGLTSTCSITVSGGTEPVTTTLSPVHDAYLQGATAYNNSLVRVESGNRVGYLMFDLSGVNGPITNAELQITCVSDAGTGNISIDLGNSSGWTETNLSTSNAPGSAGLLGNINTTYSVGSSYAIDLAEGSLSGGSNLSLIVTQTNGNDMAFASKENSATSAQLVLTYDAPKSATPEMLKSLDINSLAIYPNPARDNITIEFVSNQTTDVSYKVFDLKGTVLLTDAFIADYGKNSISVSLNNIPYGSYIIQITSSENVVTKRLIKSLR